MISRIRLEAVGADPSAISEEFRTVMRGIADQIGRECGIGEEVLERILGSQQPDQNYKGRCTIDPDPPHLNSTGAMNKQQPANK